MADGVDITAGVGTKILTDDTGASGHAQVMKVAYSADGVATLVQVDADGMLVNLGTNNDVTVTGTVSVSTVPAPLSTTGGGTEATAQRVTIATDSTGVLSVDDNGGSITVDGSVGVSSVPAPLSTIGNGTAATALRVSIASDTTGVVAVTDNAGSLTVDNGGTFAVQATIAAGATSIAKAEDVASADADVGVPSMAVRKAAPANTSGTDGDYEMLQMSAGRLWASTTIDAALPAGANNIGDVDVLTVPAPLSTTGNGTAATALRVSIASDTTGVLAVTDNGGSLTVDGTVEVSSVPSPLSTSGNGTAATAHRVTIASDSTGVIGVTDNAGSLTVDGTITASNTAGDVAHDGADSGNPVKVGGKAASSLPTAVSSGDRANLITDLRGRLLISHIDPAMYNWKSGSFTSAQTGTALWTPTSGNKVAITSIVLGSFATTAARVIIWYGASGDTTYTAGTDQLVLAASFAPGANSKPGLVFTPYVPVYSTTTNDILRITTDAAISIDVAVHGYEF